MDCSDYYFITTIRYRSLKRKGDKKQSRVEIPFFCCLYPRPTQQSQKEKNRLTRLTYNHLLDTN